MLVKLIINIRCFSHYVFKYIFCLGVSVSDSLSSVLASSGLIFSFCKFCSIWTIDILFVCLSPEPVTCLLFDSLVNVNVVSV